MSQNIMTRIVDSPKWIKSKKATINPENNDDKCFQYALNAGLIYEEIRNHPKKISKVQSFIDQHNWKEVPFDFPSYQKDWKKF